MGEAGRKLYLRRTQIRLGDGQLCQASGNITGAYDLCKIDIGCPLSIPVTFVVCLGCAGWGVSKLGSIGAYVPVDYKYDNAGGEDQISVLCMTHVI